MWRKRGIRSGAIWVLLFAAISLFGCASGKDEGTAISGETAVASPTIASEAATTSSEPETTTTTEPPPPDYAAIYLQLHDEAVAFIMNPLEQPSDAINCVQNVDCIVVKNQAIDGQFWRGMGSDNLTVSSVEVLDEISSDLVHLKVTVNAEELIELVDSNGEVIESVGVPTDAAERVALIKQGEGWIFSGPSDGRRWERSRYEAPPEPFSLDDPLDEPMTPTGEEGVTDDGVAWRTLTTEDRFCLEASTPSIGKMTRCLSAPPWDVGALRYSMNFSGDSATGQEYIVMWFGLKVDEAAIFFEDDTEQRTRFFPVDSSAAFRDDVELSIAISKIDQRPLAVSAYGPETESHKTTFDWPVPKDNPNDTDG
ncbi:MAG: hypothetical protein ACRBK7_09305 [Acidimicrobiales bacterium]